jgi:2-dehydro-3-deoxyphosphogluconate aldolase/(4S)-4-hydroxy-2-oxoglutarate aldolase
VLDALKQTRLPLGRGIRQGVGTVLTVEQARDALQAGAEFLVTPAFNPAVIRTAREANVAVVSGAFTPTEIVQAHDAGASLVMVFPAGSVGPRYIQDLRGALPHIPLMPRGGVSLENAGAFIHAGAAALGVGDDLATRDLLERRDFRGIAARFREFVDAVARARGRDPRPAPSVKPIEGPDTR